MDIFRENRFAVNTLALASGGWDVTERDSRRPRGTVLVGKGRDGMERGGTGSRGTGRGGDVGT